MSRSNYSFEQFESYLLQTMEPAERERLEMTIFEDDDLVLDLFDAEEELM